MKKSTKFCFASIAACISLNTVAGNIPVLNASTWAELSISKSFSETGYVYAETDATLGYGEYGVGDSFSLENDSSLAVNFALIQDYKYNPDANDRYRAQLQYNFVGYKGLSSFVGYRYELSNSTKYLRRYYAGVTYNSFLFQVNNNTGYWTEDGLGGRIEIATTYQFKEYYGIQPYMRATYNATDQYTNNFVVGLTKAF